MTTNQTIDGVSRRMLTALLCQVSEFHNRALVDELRALLDAPAFELVEPVAPWFYFVECDDPDYSGLFNHESEAQTQANDHGGKVVRLWNVPPTWKPAAQPQGEPVPITDDMNRLMVAYAQGEFGLEGGSETVEAMSVASFDSVKSHGHDADSYTAGYCAALYEQAKPFVWLALQPKAEQPRGEPVAWQYRVSAGPQTGWSLWHDGKGEEFKQSYQVETRPLYAEQPAPVAVVLPERKHHVHQGLSHTDAKADGWNACIDEVNRLNTPQ